MISGEPCCKEEGDLLLVISLIQRIFSYLVVL